MRRASPQMRLACFLLVVLGGNMSCGSGDCREGVPCLEDGATRSPNVQPWLDDLRLETLVVGESPQGPETTWLHNLHVRLGSPGGLRDGVGSAEARIWAFRRPGLSPHDAYRLALIALGDTSPHVQRLAARQLAASGKLDAGHVIGMLRAAREGQPRFRSVLMELMAALPPDPNGCELIVSTLREGPRIVRREAVKAAARYIGECGRELVLALQASLRDPEVQLEAVAACAASDAARPHALPMLGDALLGDSIQLKSWALGVLERTGLEEECMFRIVAEMLLDSHSLFSMVGPNSLTPNAGPSSVGFMALSALRKASPAEWKSNQLRRLFEQASEEGGGRWDDPRVQTTALALAYNGDCSARLVPAIAGAMGADPLDEFAADAAMDVVGCLPADGLRALAPRFLEIIRCERPIAARALKVLEGNARWGHAMLLEMLAREDVLVVDRILGHLLGRTQEFPTLVKDIRRLGSRCSESWRKERLKGV